MGGEAKRRMAANAALGKPDKICRLCAPPLRLTYENWFERESLRDLNQPDRDADATHVHKWEDADPRRGIKNHGRKLSRMIQGFPIWQRQQAAQQAAIASLPKPPQPTRPTRRGFSRSENESGSAGKVPIPSKSEP
jgi:hypothetical protein